MIIGIISLFSHFKIDAIDWGDVILLINSLLRFDKYYDFYHFDKNIIKMKHPCTGLHNEDMNKTKK